MRAFLIATSVTGLVSQTGKLTLAAEQNAANEEKSDDLNLIKLELLRRL